MGAARARHDGLMNAVALLVCALLLASPAQAGGKRMLDEAESREWRAVGRLNIAGSRFCTATLIAERIALTAAHCLFHPRTGEAVPTGEMVFVAGLRLGGYAAARRVARTATPRGYVPADAGNPRSLSADVALVELAEPISAGDAAAIDFGAEPSGARGSLVSYARDRAHAPSIEENCGVAAVSGALREIDCQATFGASGAPVIAEADGARRVVGVISATAQRPSGNVAIAVMIAPLIDALLAELGAERF